MQLAQEIPDIDSAVKETIKNLEKNKLPMLDYQILRWIPGLDETKYPQLTPEQRPVHGINKLRTIKTFQRK